jgi:hypothetical protein
VNYNDNAIIARLRELREQNEYNIGYDNYLIIEERLNLLFQNARFQLEQKIQMAIDANVQMPDISQTPTTNSLEPKAYGVGTLKQAAREIASHSRSVGSIATRGMNALRRVGKLAAASIAF